MRRDRRTSRSEGEAGMTMLAVAITRWFKYDQDDLCVNKSQFVPVIFKPPCINFASAPVKILHTCFEVPISI